MKLRLLKPWNQLAVGDVIEPDRVVADLLVARGVAVLIEEPQAQPKRISHLRARLQGLPGPLEIKTRKGRRR